MLPYAVYLLSHLPGLSNVRDMSFDAKEWEATRAQFSGIIGGVTMVRAVAASTTRRYLSTIINLSFIVIEILYFSI